jgi:hypothetical protein
MRVDLIDGNMQREDLYRQLLAAYREQLGLISRIQAIDKTAKLSRREKRLASQIDEIEAILSIFGSPATGETK